MRPARQHPFAGSKQGLRPPSPRLWHAQSPLLPVDVISPHHHHLLPFCTSCVLCSRVVALPPSDVSSYSKPGFHWATLLDPPTPHQVSLLPPVNSGRWPWTTPTTTPSLPRPGTMNACALYAFLRCLTPFLKYHQPECYGGLIPFLRRYPVCFTLRDERITCQMR